MTLRLYGYWRSSSAWRVRIGLGLKGLAWEPVAVNLAAGDQFSDAHRARSPLAQVPVLEVEEDGRTVRLVQSMAILEWLEERFPDPPLLPPDLAVEVLSPSNTKKEMERKRLEYFKAGTRLVWEIDPESRTATAYTDPEKHTLLHETESLNGGDVLPGFSLSLAELFSELDAHFGATGQ